MVHMPIDMGKFKECYEIDSFKEPVIQSKGVMGQIDLIVRCQ